MDEGRKTEPSRPNRNNYRTDREYLKAIAEYKTERRRWLRSDLPQTSILWHAKQQESKKKKK